MEDNIFNITFVYSIIIPVTRDSYVAIVYTASDPFASYAPLSYMKSIIIIIIH